MQKDRSIHLMTEGDLRREIIFFTIPIFIGNLFQQFYNTADSLIVGNFLGAKALAAVSGVGSLVFLFTDFFMGFATGSGVVIARYIGAGDDEDTAKAVHTSVAIGLLLSLIMTTAGILLSPLILRWMGTPADVLALSNTYLRIYFAGFTGLILYNTFTGILQAAGDSRHPLYYLVASSLINIVLDILFITVFHMGVGGAAFATILSEILTAVLAGWRLMHVPSSVRLCLKKISFDHGMLAQIVRYGIPTAMQGCVIDLSNILIQAYINSFGAAAMAGIGASTKAEGFIFLPVTAFSLSMTTFISQNMGAGKHNRVREGIRFGFAVSLTLIETLGVIFFLFAPQIISLFNQDPEVIAIGVLRARTCAFFYFLVGFSHIASAVMRGLGKPATPMVIMLVCWCAVRVAALFTIGEVWHNITLACWIYPFTWTLSAAAFVIELRKYFRNLKITDAE